ncbi:hypothetical protein HXX76_006643 [Chlamydomonas incerta]|uniref:Calponin-homology (CH) domain-containing protein n=1 Tax=Chlamydomonas incerta TaxID=51695 RepID=A0A835W425_CHLIN|nr:hypothetical protein HXX76_006643 [Chlamydomonas incerta]|eukprot:KAG2436334.1 hypothetical protein HXX76_006643 [Chlamydomonas incerta]
MALHEEQSSQAMQSVADLSSIYSMPESALNAAVGALTPISYTTAAVSELDTPTSSGSREEEYYKSSPGGNGSFGSPRGATSSAAITARRSGGGTGLVSGYEDYVQPAAWTSLRERHSNAGPSPVGGDLSLQPGGDLPGGHGATAGRLTAEQQLAAALGSGEDRASSGNAAAPSEGQALPPALSLGDSVSGRAASFGLPTLAAGVAGALTVDSAANLADAMRTAPESASAADRERAGSSQLIRSLSFGGLAPGSVSNVNTPAVSGGGANALPSADGVGVSPKGLAAAASPQRFSLEVATASVSTSMRLQQPSQAGERGGISSLTFVNPLFDPAHPENSSGAAAAEGAASDGGQSSGAALQHDDGALEDAAGDSGRELEAAEGDEESQEFIEEDIPEPESAGDEEPAVGQVMAAQAAALGEASRDGTEEPPLAVASSPQGTTGSGSGGAGLLRQQSWGSSAAGLAAAAGAGAGNAPPLRVDAAGEAAGGTEAAAAVDERPIVTAAARFMSSPGGLAQAPTAAAVALDRGFASAGGVAGNSASLLPTSADAAMHTPWMDAATAAAAAGSGALLRFSAGSTAAAAAAAVSQGGASGYSGMSAALVGAVPQQDREERVRSWAQTEADFAAMPMGSGSNGGAGTFHEAGSIGGGTASAAAEMPSDAASMMTRAAAAAAAAGLAIPGAPLGAGRASTGPASQPHAATAPEGAAADPYIAPAAAAQAMPEQASPAAFAAGEARPTLSGPQLPRSASTPAAKDSLEARMAQVLQNMAAEPSPDLLHSTGGDALAVGAASSPAARVAIAPAQAGMPIITHASGGSGSAMSVTAAAEAALAALTTAAAAAQYDRPPASLSRSPATVAVSTQPAAVHRATEDVAAVSHPAPSPDVVARQNAEARATGAEGGAAAESDAAMDADLDRLLSMLSGRGARSEAHMRMGFDSFRSAVVTAAITPRPRSAPGIATLAAAMAEAAAEVAAEEEQQRGQQHSSAAVAAAMSVRSAGRASLASSVGGNSPRSPLDAAGRLAGFATGTAERGSAQLPTLSRISAGASPRAQPDVDSAAASPPSAMRPTSSITLQPHPAPVHHQSHHQLNFHGHPGAQARSSGLPEHPHPHLQPHLPLHPHLHMHPSVGGSASAGTHPPQPLSTTASLASIDSEVAAERLKAKTRAYLARGSGGGGSKDPTASPPEAATQRSGPAAVVVVPSSISDMRGTPAHAARAAGTAAPFRDSAGMELSLMELHLPLDDLLVQAQRLRIAEEEAEGEGAEAEEVEEEEGLPGSDNYEEGVEQQKPPAAGQAGVAVAAVASAVPALGDSSSELDDIIRQLHSLMGAAAAAKAVQLDRAAGGGAVASYPYRSPEQQQAHEDEERRELAHLREVQQMARDEVAHEQLAQRQQHLWEEEQEQSRRRADWLQEDRERQEREARAVAALQRFGDMGSPVRGVVQAYDTTGSVSLRLEEENSRSDVSPWGSGPSTDAPSPPVSRASGWAPAQQQAQGSGANGRSASARASGSAGAGYAANRRQQHGRAEAARPSAAPASASATRPAAAPAAGLGATGVAADADGSSMASYLQLAAQAAALRSQVDAAYSGHGSLGAAAPLMALQPPPPLPSVPAAPPQPPLLHQQPDGVTAGLGGPQSSQWHAALAAKLLPPDALQRHSSGGYQDAAMVLSEWKVPTAPAAEPAAASSQAASAPGARQGGASGVTSTGNGAASGTASHARAPSPAGRRTTATPAGADTGGASSAASRSRRPGSAPSTPARGNSPARQHIPGSGVAAAAAPGARDGGTFPLNSAKSPRSGRDARGGNSILDRAAQRAGTAALGGASPTRGRASSPAAADPGAEPISIRRPFAWQERETRHWLEDLGLMVSPVEEAAPLLDNPLRNGLLLAALAVRLTGTPLPTGVLTDPPRDMRSARTNILCAVDHLGLLAAPWAPPASEEQRARAESAASDLAAAAAAIGSGNGRSRSPSPSRSGANMGSSGIIAIKALGNAGRGYALRLKERQLRAGLGLVAEVEAVLAGNADSVWGLLNFIRLACAPQYMMGSGALNAGRGGGRGGFEDMHSRRTFDVRGGPGPNGTAMLGPAPTAGMSSSPSRAASPARPITAAASRPGSRAASPARSPGISGITAAAGSPGGAGSVSPRKMYSTIVSEQAVLASRAGHRGGVLVHGAVADPRGSLGALLHANGAAAAAAAAAAATSSGLLYNQGAGAGGGGASSSAAGAAASDVPAGLLYRPLWPRLTALPYGASELAALESSLLRWLMESGSISRREAAEGFRALLPMFEDGTFICWLVSNLSGRPIVGAHRRPLTDTARRTNWLKAIEVLRVLPGMSRRFLVHEEALIHCCRPELTGLLEDLHRLADGQPPPPGTLLPDAQPYLPYVAPMPEPEMLDPEMLALNRTALTLPARATVHIGGHRSPTTCCSNTGSGI